jgi:hypothetical protein
VNLVLDIPYCHHEKWDGMGYPRGLKGEQIPLVDREGWKDETHRPAETAAAAFANMYRENQSKQ